MKEKTTLVNHNWGGVYRAGTRKMLKQSELTERITYLRSSVKRIGINENEAIIHYNITLPPVWVKHSDGKCKVIFWLFVTWGINGHLNP